MAVTLFISFLPSRFILFATLGYMLVTATVAAAMPKAAPAANPNSFLILLLSIMVRFYFAPRKAAS